MIGANAHKVHVSGLWMRSLFQIRSTDSNTIDIRTFLPSTERRPTENSYFDQMATPVGYCRLTSPGRETTVRLKTAACQQVRGALFAFQSARPTEFQAQKSR